jgi:hypothetical protein
LGLEKLIGLFIGDDDGFCWEDPNPLHTRLLVDGGRLATLGETLLKGGLLPDASPPPATATAGVPSFSLLPLPAASSLFFFIFLQNFLFFF